MSSHSFFFRPVATRVLASAALASCLLVSTAASAQWVNLAATGSVQVHSAGAAYESSNTNPGSRNMITWDDSDTQKLAPSIDRLDASAWARGPGGTYATGLTQGKLTVWQSPEHLTITGDLDSSYGTYKLGGSSSNNGSLQGQASFDLLSPAEVQVQGRVSAGQVSSQSLGLPTTTPVASLSPNASVNVSLIGPNGQVVWQPTVSATAGAQNEMLTLALAAGHYDLRVAASTLADNTRASTGGILGSNVTASTFFYADVRMIPEPARASLMLMGLVGMAGVMLSGRRHQAVVNTATESTS